MASKKLLRERMRWKCGFRLQTNCGRLDDSAALLDLMVCPMKDNAAEKHCDHENIPLQYDT
jgi:hypothetical protein